MDYPGRTRPPADRPTIDMAHLDASSFGAGRGLSTRGESGEEIGRCANVHVDAVGFRRQQAIGEPGRHEDGRREAIFELTAPGLDDQRACKWVRVVDRSPWLICLDSPALARSCKETSTPHGRSTLARSVRAARRVPAKASGSRPARRPHFCRRRSGRVLRGQHEASQRSRPRTSLLSARPWSRRHRRLAHAALERRGRSERTCLPERFWSRLAWCG